VCISLLSTLTTRSADSQSISICPNCRAKREFLIASQPQRREERRGPEQYVVSAFIASLWLSCAVGLVAASLRCAVSQNCNLQSSRDPLGLAFVRRPADYKSAIQQIENLRYFSQVGRRRTSLRSGPLFQELPRPRVRLAAIILIQDAGKDGTRFRDAGEQGHAGAQFQIIRIAEDLFGRFALELQ